MDCVLRLTACLYTQHSQTSDHKLRSQLAAFAEREKLQRIVARRDADIALSGGVCRNPHPFYLADRIA
jgi:hypothetical protein